MKILLVTPRFYPEPFTITRIAKELSDRGHEITVLTGRPNYGKWKVYDGYKRIKNEKFNNIKIIRSNEIPRKKGVAGLIINYFSIYFSFKKELRKLKDNYDIVFSHVMSPILSMNGLRKFCKKQNIPHYHYGFDLWPESLVATGYMGRKNLFFKIIRKISISNYKSCDLISFASPSAEKYFRNYLKIDKPFLHIYQPCLTEMPDFNSINKDEYCKNGKIHVLFCGTVAKFNHLDLIIDALNDETIKNKVIFEIVGSGSDKDRIELMVKKNNLSDNVIFYGRVKPEETKVFYKNADILFVPLFCNSATSLMIPQKLIEYLMYGRPIFGMIKGDGAELLKKASPFNVVSDQDVDCLKENLKRFINMPINDMKECGRMNRLFIEENDCFKLKTICDKIESCLTSLVKNKAEEKYEK